MRDTGGNVAALPSKALPLNCKIDGEHEQTWLWIACSNLGDSGKNRLRNGGDAKHRQQKRHSGYFRQQGQELRAARKGSKRIPATSWLESRKVKPAEHAYSRRSVQKAEG